MTWDQAKKWLPLGSVVGGFLLALVFWAVFLRGGNVEEEPKEASPTASQPATEEAEPEESNKVAQLKAKIVRLKEELARQLASQPTANQPDPAAAPPTRADEEFELAGKLAESVNYSAVLPETGVALGDAATAKANGEADVMRIEAQKGLEEVRFQGARQALRLKSEVQLELKAAEENVLRLQNEKIQAEQAAAEAVAARERRRSGPARYPTAADTRAQKKAEEATQVMLAKASELAKAAERLEVVRNDYVMANKKLAAEVAASATSQSQTQNRTRCSPCWQ